MADDTKVPGQVTLLDGRIATVRKAIGKDLERGASAVGNMANPMSLMMGVAAQVTTVDGAGITYEEVQELDVTDVFQLIGAIMGNGLSPSLLSAISSSSGARPN